MKVRMTYTNPEQLRPIVDERTGRVFYVRINDHPTREARPYEFNSWVEERDEQRQHNHA